MTPRTFDYNRLFALWESDLSINEISQKLKVKRGTIRNVAYRYNLKDRSAQFHKKIDKCLSCLKNREETQKELYCIPCARRGRRNGFHNCGFAILKSESICQRCGI